MVNDPADERTATDPRNQLGQNAVAHAIARIGLCAHFWPVALVFPLARGIKPLGERVDRPAALEMPNLVDAVVNVFGATPSSKTPTHTTK